LPSKNAATSNLPKTPFVLRIIIASRANSELTPLVSVRQEGGRRGQRPSWALAASQQGHAHGFPDVLAMAMAITDRARHAGSQCWHHRVYSRVVAQLQDVSSPHEVLPRQLEAVDAHAAPERQDFDGAAVQTDFDSLRRAVDPIGPEPGFDVEVPRLQDVDLERRALAEAPGEGGVVVGEDVVAAPAADLEEAGAAGAEVDPARLDTGLRLGGVGGEVEGVAVTGEVGRVLGGAAGEQEEAEA